MVRLTRIHFARLYILLSLSRPRGDTPGTFIHCTADAHSSKSWIIDEEKTKEITPLKEVWMSDPNYHKFSELLLWISLRIINVLRRYIELWKESFIRYPNTSKLVKKNLAAPRFFNPPLSDWISDETSFLMFDIFLKLHKDRPIDLYGENNLTSWRGLLGKIVIHLITCISAGCLRKKKNAPETMIFE